jgi:hypothetical protein
MIEYTSWLLCGSKARLVLGAREAPPDRVGLFAIGSYSCYKVIKIVSGSSNIGLATGNPKERS